MLAGGEDERVRRDQSSAYYNSGDLPQPSSNRPVDAHKDGVQIARQMLLKDPNVQKPLDLKLLDKLAEQYSGESFANLAKLFVPSRTRPLPSASRLLRYVTTVMTGGPPTPHHRRPWTAGVGVGCGGRA